MVKLARSVHPWLSLALLGLFCVVAYGLSVRQTLIVANSLLLVISGTVACVYLPKAIRAMRERRDPAIQHITYGIVLGWGDTFLWRLLIMLWLLTDQRPALVNNDILSGLYAGAALGAFYHLTSPGAMARGFWPRAVACALVVVVSVVLAAVLILVPPDLTWVAVHIEPYVPR
jgi:hypothetical protein